MHIDHDISNKFISFCQPLEILIQFLKNITLAKSVINPILKRYLHLYDLVDDNPLPLTNLVQSLRMQIIVSLLFLPFTCRYFLLRQEFVFIYKICISKSFELVRVSHHTWVTAVKNLAALESFSKEWWTWKLNEEHLGCSYVSLFFVGRVLNISDTPHKPQEVEKHPL